MVKVLHLPSSFFPSSTGGKEIFVLKLIENMPQMEHRVLIHSESGASCYHYNNIRIDVLLPPVVINKAQSYYGLEYSDLSGFEEYLNSYLPDIVHFHDQGEFASLTHLKKCHSKGIKTVITYHSPGQSCLQRGLLFEGKAPCKGIINIKTCTYCRYRNRHFPSWLSTMITSLDLPFDLNGRYVLRNSTNLFKQSWIEFYDLIDVVQVHARWVTKMLLDNGVDENKIKYLKLGGPSTIVYPKNENEYNAPLKLVFVGRCTDVKGVHLLIDAVKSLSTSHNVEVHFFGPYWDNSDYGLLLQKKTQRDSRFKRPKLLNPNEVLKELSSMDVCIVPSLWPETGPFTVLDAFAAKIPVIGTRLAGIQERVRDGIDGLLFNWGDSNDLAAKIIMLFNDRKLLYKLKSNIQVNYTYSEMATNFSEIYSTLLNA
jgi:glycosyltransferase involved in cell wall biosynthesis